MFDDIQGLIRSHSSRTGNILTKTKNRQKSEELSTKTRQKNKYQAAPTLLKLRRFVTVRSSYSTICTSALNAMLS